MSRPATPLFLDTEFTALDQTAALVSLALVSRDGGGFYAEFSDWERAGCDAWVREHVIPRTRWLARPGVAPETRREGGLDLCFGDRAQVARALAGWLAGRGPVEVWGDCPAYDWVLFCELFGGARQLPGSVFYIPFDLATLFRLRGLDPDTDRAAFAGADGDAGRHNALWDARVIGACWERLQGMG